MLKQIRQFSLVELLTNLGVPNAAEFLAMAQASTLNVAKLELSNGWALNLITGHTSNPEEFSICLFDASKHLRIPYGIALSFYKHFAESGFSLGKFAELSNGPFYATPTLLPIYAFLAYDTSAPGTKLRAALAPFFTEE